MVVIAIMGVLTAAISTNWASFMRHQELRQDAISLHKEIIALKARAMKNNDTARLISPTSGAQCSIKWFVPDTDNPDVRHPKFKLITFNNGVTIFVGNPKYNNSDDVGGLPIISKDAPTPNTNKNYWIGSGSTPPICDTIMAIPDNLEAFKDGRLVVKSDNAKARYCIQKASESSIRPEIYYQSKAGNTWKRM